MLAQDSKTPMQAVHYRGEALMIQDLISGQVDFAARTSSAAMSRRHAARAGDDR
jgi:tripartite-type tricarboxylate transporter receptor subunit TctC